MSAPAPKHLKSLQRDALFSFLAENLNVLSEDEAVAVLENPFITPKLCGVIAQTQRLVAFYSVRLRLVAHRQTPQAHAIKLIHYLRWPDLVRLSVEVTVPPTTRRAIDTLVLTRVAKLTLGEKIAAARRCSAALIKVFLFDRDPRVFASLLVNQRLREDDLLLIASSSEATVDQLVMLAGDRKWSCRYAVRKALVLNPLTPRSIAASQLRFLNRRDLRQIHDNPSTSVYLQRCIERLEPHVAAIAQ